MLLLLPSVREGSSIVFAILEGGQMKHCCEDKADELRLLRMRQGNVLKVVLGLNLIMFVVEMLAGIRAQSTSLMGDSLDMLGDSFVYAFSLFVLFKSIKWRAIAALLKGAIMTAFGLGVLIEAGAKVFSDVVPQAHIISGIGILALAVNSVCLFLLTRHRDDDINMKSTWLCSRNDIIANCGVIAAGITVTFLDSKWPDILVGTIIACVFLASALSVTRESLKEIRHAT